MTPRSEIEKAYHRAYTKTYREKHKYDPKPPKKIKYIEEPVDDYPDDYTAVCSTFGCGKKLSMLETLCGSKCFQCSAPKKKKKDKRKFKPVQIDLNRILSLFIKENGREPAVIIMNDLTFRKLAAEIFDNPQILTGELKVVDPGKFKGIPIVRSEDTVKDDEYKML